MLNAALAALNIGRVFPLRPYSKKEYKEGHPLDRSHATNDPKQIRAWWSGNAKHNIGILLPTNVVCVDVDTEHMAAFNREIPGTLMDRTPSGGLHIFFRLPAGLSCKSVVLPPPPDCEIFGTGGRIVAASSITKADSKNTADGEYETIDPSPIAMAPKWLIEIVKAHQPSVFTVPTAIERSGDGFTTYGEKALFGQLADLCNVTKGKDRTTTLNTVAFCLGQLVPHGDLTEAVIEQHLTSAIQGWGDERHYASVIRKGIAAGIKKPRNKTPRDQKKTQRVVVAEMRRLKKNCLNRGKYPTGITKGKLKGKKVLAMIVRDCLDVFLDAADRANSLTVNMSERQMSEEAHISLDSARKGIHALQTLNLIKFEKAHTFTKGTTFRLSINGFMTLQKSSANTPTTLLTEGEAHSSPSKLVDGVLLEDFLLRSSGVFRRGALGQGGLPVTECLLDGSAKTKADITRATGLAETTAGRAVDKLVAAGMVTKSGRNYTLTPNYKALVLGYLMSHVTPSGKTLIERDNAKHEKHKGQRKAMADTLAWRAQQRTEKQYADYVALMGGPEAVPEYEVETYPAIVPDYDIVYGHRHQLTNHEFSAT